MTPRKPLLERAPVLLLLGCALVAAANLRWGIGILAWIAPLPLLRYLRLTSGWKSRVAFGLTFIAAWIVTMAKIVTEPLPLGFALLGIGFGAFPLTGYLLADGFRRRFGDWSGVLAFPALMVVIEWAQHRFTEFASWGAAAYTQLGDLPLLQIASITGISGVSFLVYWVSASFELLIHERSGTAKRMTAAAIGTLIACHIFGAVRLAQSSTETIKVAAIGTDATFDGRAQPDDATRARTLDHLFEDTRRAARSGAKLAVWTEAAALVMSDEEQDLVERVRNVAKEERIGIVAAYVVPKQVNPLRFENKYQWIRDDGSIDHTYFKHHPAPGEPALIGTEPHKAVETELGRFGGALCYDYDFPELAREHGALNLDLIALPSSDWRGIDPIHTEMAALRAIEEGFSILRSTRFGLSAGIDRWGRMRMRVSSFDTSERLQLVDLPRRGASTVYREIGDAFVYANIALLLGLATRRLFQRQSSPHWTRVGAL